MSERRANRGILGQKGKNGSDWGECDEEGVVKGHVGRGAVKKNSF